MTSPSDPEPKKVPSTNIDKKAKVIEAYPIDVSKAHHNQSTNSNMSTSRLTKMRDIKNEIGDLMSKIDNASRQIQESYLQPNKTTK